RGSRCVGTSPSKYHVPCSGETERMTFEGGIKMNRTGWWIGGLLAFLLVIGAVFSWTPNRSPGPTGERTGLRQNAPSGQEISNRQGLPNTANRDMTEARKAAAAASNVSGVRTAHAFVKDRTAYIGIVPDTP